MNRPRPAPRCRGCMQTIGPGQAVVADGYAYHKECWRLQSARVAGQYERPQATELQRWFDDGGEGREGE